MSKMSRPVTRKKPDQEELPIHVQLERKFSLNDLRQAKPKVVNAIFEFYYPKLEQKIPDWLRNAAIMEDASGLASQILLDVIQRCEQYGSFKELDEDIHTSFEKSKDRASSEAGAKKYYKSKESALDAPLKDGENDGSRHNFVVDKDARNGLDLLINKQDGLLEEDDQKKAEQEQQKELINATAKSILSASQWNIYNLYTNKHMSIEAIASDLNKTHVSIRYSLQSITSDIQATLMPGVTVQRSSPERSLNQSDSDYAVVLRAYKMGVALEKIQKRFGLSENALIHLVKNDKEGALLTQQRTQAFNRQIYQAYAVNMPKDEIIHRFNLKNNAFLEEIIRTSGNAMELRARRAVDRSKPTPLDELAQRYAQQQSPNAPVSEDDIEKYKRQLLAASWHLTPERRKVFFLYYQEGVPSREIARLQKKTKDVVFSYLGATKNIVLKHVEKRSKLIDFNEVLTPLEMLVREGEDTTQPEEELKKKREEKTKRILIGAKNLLSPEKEKIFLHYFKEGRTKSEVEKLVGFSNKILSNTIYQIRDVLKNGLAKGFPGELTPLDLLVREGEDISQSEEQLNIVREQKKRDILANVNFVLHPNRAKLFAFYFEQGRDRAEVAQLMDMSEKVIANSAYEIRETLRKYLIEGFPERVTPLDLLVREGEEESSYQTKEELEAARNNKKSKARANVKKLLSSQNQQIFSLFYEQGWERKEIAKHLGISRSFVTNSVTYIKNTLTQELEEERLMPLDFLVREEEDTQLSQEDLERIRNEKKEKIRVNIKNILNTQYQKIFYLFFEQGYKTPQMSKLMKLSTEQINKKIYEIKGILRKGLTKGFPENLTPLDMLVREGEDTSLAPEEMEDTRTRKKKMIIKAADNVLDEKRKQVFDLYFVEGRMPKETGRLLKVKDYMVKHHIKIIREKISPEIERLQKKADEAKENAVRKGLPVPDSYGQKPKRAKHEISEKAEAARPVILRAYRMGVSFINIMARYDIKTYSQFYSIISKSQGSEEAIKGRLEMEERNDKILSDRICADYTDNMLMDDMTAKYSLTHTTILSIIRKTGQAEELIKKRKFTYNALPNDRQRQVAALFRFQGAAATAKTMSTFESFVYRDKDAIKKKLEVLEKIPRTDAKNMPNNAFSLIGRSAGMFTFDKKLNKKYTDLVLKAKEQGHLDEIYAGLERTLKDMQNHSADTVAKIEARTAFKRAALDIVALCGKASLDDDRYQKIMNFIID